MTEPKQSRLEEIEKDYLDATAGHSFLDPLNGVADNCFNNAVDYARSLQQRVEELEELLISARCIAKRQGEQTHWERFDNAIARAGIGNITAKVFKILPSDPVPLHKLEQRNQILREGLIKIHNQASFSSFAIGRVLCEWAAETLKAEEELK